MGLITCAGADVLSGRIVLPLRGAWTAELVLDRATTPSGKVDLVAEGGLNLKGAVQPGRAGVELDAAHVRLVGGAAGLAAEVAGAYRTAQLRDPLDAILRASGETLAATTAAEVLGVSLPFFTLGRCRCGPALDDLAAAAGAALGKTIHWRFLGDGTLWLGAETWPSATLPDTADVLERHPAERRVELGVQTPVLLPGVNLTGVGQVIAVEHWLGASQIRSWAWT